MANRFNLNVLPILRYMEKTVSALPGLLIANPPRRSPRRRMQERLILHLHLEGNAPLSDTATGQLLTKLAEVYFETDGSTTSALRNVTDVLNKYLLDRNYRAASRGLKAVGFLTQVVLREDKVLYAQCGPSYIFKVMPDAVEDLYDPDLSGSGLGLGKAFKVRYHQINLLPNQLIILTPKTPQTWTDNLFKNLSRMKLSAVVQRLMHKVDENLEAILLFPVEGEGELKVVEPNWNIGVGALEMPEIDQEPASEPIPAPIIDSTPDSTSKPIQIPEDEEPILDPPRQKEKDNLPIPERIVKQTQEQVVRPDNKPGLASRVAAEIGPTINEIQDSKTWSTLSNAGSSIGDLVKKGWRILLGLVGKMLPDDQMLDLPSGTLTMIAILVPVVIVIFGSFFYINRGRNQLYDDHFSQAQTLLALSQTQEDPAEYYQTVFQAMDEILAARNYQQTDEVEEIYGTLRGELDALDRITRLDYQPLFSRGLGVDVTISKIVVTAWNDLYMLNADQGTVIWAQSNPDGYQLIDEFSCGPIEGHISVGPLVDIIALPTSQEDQATILGVDKNHTMIFCYADLDETPVIFEDTSYTLGRGPAKSITMSSSTPYNLYILDPEKRAIWIEYQSQNYHEGSEYFGAVDSPAMADAIELVTSGSELFILHSDGYVTKCVTERADSDPLCTTPFEYSDPRPGHDSGPFFDGAKFDSITIKGSPGLAIYLLDTADQALYRFSTQLEFQEQFRPEAGIIDKPATAFTVTMSDKVFLAVDDQVYSAQLLP
ncbi:MAG: hypothetical protein HQ574_08470 [Chloroflexi bacterium]|nr:hypothetical protein [Chloroflexota bacterium]